MFTMFWLVTFYKLAFVADFIILSGEVTKAIKVILVIYMNAILVIASVTIFEIIRISQWVTYFQVGFPKLKVPSGL